MKVLYTSSHGEEIQLLSGSAETEELRRLFAQIADEQGWQPGVQLQTLGSTSVYLALRLGGEIIGGLQLVRSDNEFELPCLGIWPEINLDGQTDIAHIRILALSRQYRGKGDLFWLLCVELWRYCAASGISQLYLEVTPPTLRVYRRIGWPLQIVGDLRSHWGEECYLCSMRVGELADICMSRAQTSALYRRIVCQGLRLSANGKLAGCPK